MSTTWTETANQICRDGLEHVGALGAGETPSSTDQQKALGALNAVLKRLPLAGYHWPKLSGEVSLTWSNSTPSIASVPADYYGFPLVWKTSNSQKVPLTEIPHANWVRMTNRDATAPEPTHFYVTPDNVITFYPVPDADPAAYLQYQRIVDDANLTTAPIDFVSYWMNPLGWGVADEISLDYGLDKETRIEIAQRWTGKRDAALQSSISSSPICFSVDD